MRTARTVLLAIVATLALAGGIASTADARGGPHKATPTTPDSPADGFGQIDPGDPPVQPGP